MPKYNHSSCAQAATLLGERPGGREWWDIIRKLREIKTVEEQESDANDILQKHFGVTMNDAVAEAEHKIEMEDASNG